MSSKQDRPGLRNPAEIERRYNLGEKFYEQNQFNETIAYDLKTVTDSLGLHKQNTSENMNTLQNNINMLDESLNQAEIVKRLTNDGDGLYIGEDGNIYTRASHVTGSEILQAVYPVGAIYLSTVATNPATLFGFGEWVQIEDRFLLAAGSTYAAGATGGEAEVTLTVKQMPSHSHGIKLTSAAVQSGTQFARLSSTGSFSSGLIDNAGGSQPHNNMPPYLAVFVWQRTA